LALAMDFVPSCNVVWDIGFDSYAHIAPMISRSFFVLQGFCLRPIDQGIGAVDGIFYIGEALERLVLEI
jgi:hypothetical protein